MLFWIYVGYKCTVIIEYKVYIKSGKFKINSYPTKHSSDL